MGFRLRDGVSMVEVDNGIALLDEHEGKYWDLNATGALVLKTVLEGGSQEDAAETLAEMFAVEPAVAAQDAADLLAALRAARLVDEQSGKGLAQ